MVYQRKADDSQIIDLNSVGLSLTSIGERLGVHHTTIRHRLQSLGVPPADTRRAFMEDIYEALTPGQQEWLIDQLGPGHSVKDFVRSLLISEYVTKVRTATPV